MYYVICGCNFLPSSSPHNDQPPSCSQRREPPSCNLLGLLPPGIAGQGGPLCRICTWFNICTFLILLHFSEFSPRVTTSKAILLKHTVLTTGGGSEHSHGTDLWKLLTIITLKEVCGKLVQKVRRTNHLPTSEQGRCATYTRPAAASTWVGRCLQHHRDSRQL